MNDKKPGNLGVSIFLFFLAIILLFFSIKQKLDNENDQKKLSQQVSDKVSEKVNNVLDEQKKETKRLEFPEYELYKSLKKRITFVENNQSYVTKNYKKIGEVSKVFSMEGKFRRAYVLINVSVDNGLSLTASDSIYMLLGDKGGHLLRNKSLFVPASDTTQLLYDAREIPCITSVPYSELRQPLYADWLSVFNLKKEISFYTFLSTWREGGLIKEITIAYECEQNNSCTILPK